MKDKQTDRLDELLKSWELSTPLPVRFQGRVWSRINRASSNSPGRLLGALFSHAFGSRSFQAAGLALALGLGLAAGEFHGKFESRSVRHRVEKSYLADVDPFRSGHALSQ